MEDEGAAFNSDRAVTAIQFYMDLLLKEQVAVDWTGASAAARLPALKDGRIAMFVDGPHYLNVLKRGAPEMAGKWKVITHPYSQEPSSPLSGTGLVIPKNAAHPEAAWKFIEFAMRVENQISLFKSGGAPPLSAALQSPEVTAPDPYFGGQPVFSVFGEALRTAHHFSYIREWPEIEPEFTGALQAILHKQQTVRQALDAAAAVGNSKLTE